MSDHGYTPVFTFTSMYENPPGSGIDWCGVLGGMLMTSPALTRSGAPLAISVPRCAASRDECNDR